MAIARKTFEERSAGSWLDFWMKTRPDQHTLRLECRLGGFASLNFGTAEFTAISIAEGGNPPESSDRVYGGTTLDLPHQRTMVFALVGAILAAGVLLLLWRFATSPTRRIPPVKTRPVLLCLMTLVAGWLRFTATSFGLPDKFRPDEEYVVSRALGFDQDWNPHFATYPAAQMYVDHVALVLVAKLTGDHSDFRESYVGDNGSGAYLVARRVSAALGTATIPAIYMAAAPLGS